MQSKTRNTSARSLYKFSCSFTFMAVGLEVAASGIASFLSGIAPVISLILIILGGITYGLSQTQPAEMRGKWQTAAIGMVIGGLIVGAIAGAAGFLQSQFSGLLKPV